MRSVSYSGEILHSSNCSLFFFFFLSKILNSVNRFLNFSCGEGFAFSLNVSQKYLNTSSCLPFLDYLMNSFVDALLCIKQMQSLKSAFPTAFLKGDWFHKCK